MKSITLGFIGGGRITRILLQAYRNRDITFQSVHVYETNPDVMSGLKRSFPEIVIAGSPDQAAKQNIIFIALHPPAIMEVMEKLKPGISPDSIIISLAPKFSFEKLAGLIPSENLVRMIPNATSVINEGYNPFCFSENFKAKREMIIDMLKPLGKLIEVKESKLEAYAIISAMLPTYFWFQWKAIEELGVKMGLEEEESSAAIYETMIAALDTMYKSELSTDKVYDLIPVKPIGEHEEEIKAIYKNKLISLYEKIKP